MAARKKVKRKDIRIQMSFECDVELRDAFVLTCREGDTSSARELRSFMRKFVAKNGQQKLL